MIKIFRSTKTRFVHIDTVVFSAAEDFKYSVEGNLFTIFREETNIVDVYKVPYSKFLGKNEQGVDITFSSSTELENYLESIFEALPSANIEEITFDVQQLKNNIQEIDGGIIM